MPAHCRLERQIHDDVEDESTVSCLLLSPLERCWGFPLSIRQDGEGARGWGLPCCRRRQRQAGIPGGHHTNERPIGEMHDLFCHQIVVGVDPQIDENPAI